MKAIKCFYIGLLVILLFTACSTPVAEPPTPTTAPTATAQPTATPIVYNLEVQIMDQQGSPIADARVSIDDEKGISTTDSSGAVSIENIDTDEFVVEVFAQGYLPKNTELSLEAGQNEVSIQLERDPFGLLPEEVVPEGQQLVYLEDFQDGRDEFNSVIGDWQIIEDSESPGNLVLQGIQIDSENMATVNFSPEEDLTDFTIQYQFRYLDQGTVEGNFASLEFREGYSLSISAYWKVIQILDYVNWEFPIQIEKTYQDDQWYLVKLEVKEDQVWISLDGKALGRANDIEVNPANWGFSLGQKANHVQFDNIVITTPIIK